MHRHHITGGIICITLSRRVGDGGRLLRQKRVPNRAVVSDRPGSRSNREIGCLTDGDTGDENSRRDQPNFTSALSSLLFFLSF